MIDLATRPPVVHLSREDIAVFGGIVGAIVGFLFGVFAMWSWS